MEKMGRHGDRPSHSQMSARILDHFDSIAQPSGAGDETRTRDIFLGKEVLYQLSYARASII
jgi:hypothetical protein